MNMKKTLAAALAAMMLAAPAYAESNDESRYLDILTNYAANLYIDENVSAEDLMQAATEEILKENPELMYKMIKAAFSSLDEYTEFYTAEEYESYYQHLNKIFYGMGVMIQQKEGNVEVIRIMDGGGAQAAGVLEGDILLEVDGQSVEGLSLDKITSMVAGEEGTSVHIKIRRDSVEMELDVERRRVDEATVGATVLPSDIGYIEIISFSESTPTELAEVLKDYDEKGITNIILDLRGNPGGMLESVVNVSTQIVPEGVITQTIYRNESQNETYYSDNKDTKYKFAVLVNGDTASAAEVLTGALKDSGAGYIIGETTYGKGVIQNVYNLPNGDAFKITTGHYLTRNGSDINNKGIEPDEIVKNHLEQIDISKYETFDYKTKWRIGDEGKGVLAAKQRLRIMGYYYGEINETFDPLLENAVYKFQEDAGLYPYGVLDFSTQATLENKFYVIDVMVDDQFYAAYEYFGGNVGDLE